MCSTRPAWTQPSVPWPRARRIERGSSCDSTSCRVPVAGNDQLLFSAVRELVANVVRHAKARVLSVTLRPVGDEVLLVVEDDGAGLEPERLGERLADGHIGLASQRVRIESAGGHMSVVSRPGLGTRAEVRLPR